MSTLPFQLLVAALAGWVNRGQQDVIEYLREENRVLREHLGGRRLLFTDVQRRRLAIKAKAISHQTLFGIGPVVTPDTLLRWYRTLVARKYDGSKTRKAGRPKTKQDIEQLIVRMARDNPRWGYTRIRGAGRVSSPYGSWGYPLNRSPAGWQFSTVGSLEDAPSSAGGAWAPGAAWAGLSGFGGWR